VVVVEPEAAVGNDAGDWVVDDDRCPATVEVVMGLGPAPPPRVEGRFVMENPTTASVTANRTASPGHRLSSDGRSRREAGKGGGRLMVVPGGSSRIAETGTTGSGLYSS
jgi:hypothetical protein